MRQSMIWLVVLMAVPGLAAADWRETLKKEAGKQANQKMETSLGLAQLRLPAPRCISSPRPMAPR